LGGFRRGSDGTLEEGADHADHGFAIVAEDGRLRFATRRARLWLARYFWEGPRAGNQLPGALLRWLTQQETRRGSTGDAPPVRAPFVALREDCRLVIRMVPEPGRRLLILREEFLAPRPRLLEPHGFTRREAEVLGWVGEGKTNVEIAAILGIRRRMVSKHLERVFDKLGVETRTAAAIRARELAREGDMG